MPDSFPRSAWPTLPIVLLLALVAALGLFFLESYLPAHSDRVVQEAVLKTNLRSLRTLLLQFEKDQGRGAQDLSELVEAGYLLDIPIDPVTGSRDTWRLVRVLNADGVAEIRSVHSASLEVGRDGRPYNRW